MNKLKLSLITVGVLAVAAGGTTFYAAHKAETDLRAAYDWFNKEIGEGWLDQKLQLKNAQYHKGVFNSEAQFDLTIPGTPDKLTILQHIHNGPLLKTANGWKLGWYAVDFEVDPKILAKLDAKSKAWLEQHKNLLAVGYHVGLDNTRHAFFKQGEVRFEDNGEQFVSAATTHTLDFDSALSHIRYRFALPQLSFTGKDKKTGGALKDMVLEGEIRSTEGKLDINNAQHQFSLGSLSFTEQKPDYSAEELFTEMPASEASAGEAAASDVPAEPPVKMKTQQVAIKDIQVSGNGELKDGFYNQSVSYKLGDIQGNADGLALGKDPIRSLEFGFSLKHIHAESLRGLTDSMVVMYRNLLRQSLNGNYQDMEKQLGSAAFGMGAVMIANWTTIAKHDPTISIDKFVMKTAANRSMQGDLSVTLKGLTDADIGGFNWAAIQNKLLIEGKGSVSEALLKAMESNYQADRMERLVKAQLIRRDGDTLSTEFKVAAGQITVLKRVFPSLQAFEAETRKLTDE
ncbi:DUF945 family protein [Leeia aquatica]|uniref:YdgA family protein n=1 Tax=Leeia aquatica TaxID=2725557 RepID=A0A847RTI7_9NEIS|nr:DUF945 family protein [Leeia aquatica]NLR74520.1 YdgA family protein [Leeia aquatica]